MLLLKTPIIIPDILITINLPRFSKRHLSHLLLLLRPFLHILLIPVPRLIPLPVVHLLYLSSVLVVITCTMTLRRGLCIAMAQ